VSNVVTPKGNKPALPASAEELRKLLKRAEPGDTKTLPALREMLSKADEDLVRRFGGDLAEQTESTLVNAAAGQNLVFQEALLRRLELLRAELAGPSPSPLERLLVERIVLCWLHLHDKEIRFAQAKSLTIPQADYQQRAIDRAHKRYLSAIKMLAVVRRLAIPAFQVNIARKQVNVSGVVQTGQRDAEAQSLPGGRPTLD
jgi:hypothetical protein